jgi:hypothetical protein
VRFLMVQTVNVRSVVASRVDVRSLLLQFKVSDYQLDISFAIISEGPFISRPLGNTHPTFNPSRKAHPLSKPLRNACALSRSLRNAHPLSRSLRTADPQSRTLKDRQTIHWSKA